MAPLAPDTSPTIVSQPLTFDVFGRMMAVEPAPDGWRLFVLGTDGKRSSANVVIPAFVEEAELAQYLDDVYHEAATPSHPSVTQTSPKRT